MRGERGNCSPGGGGGKLGTRAGAGGPCGRSGLGERRGSHSEASAEGLVSTGVLMGLPTRTRGPERAPQIGHGVWDAERAAGRRGRSLNSVQRPLGARRAALLRRGNGGILTRWNRGGTGGPGAISPRPREIGDLLGSGSGGSPVRNRATWRHREALRSGRAFPRPGPAQGRVGCDRAPAPAPARIGIRGLSRPRGPGDPAERGPGAAASAGAGTRGRARGFMRAGRRGEEPAGRPPAGPPLGRPRPPARAGSGEGAAWPVRPAPFAAHLICPAPSAAAAAAAPLPAPPAAPDGD